MGATLHEDRYGVFEFPLNVANCPANSTNDQNFTIVGLAPGDFVSIAAKDLVANIGIMYAVCISPNLLRIRWLNPTAAPINPGITQMTAHWFRAERILPATTG
jgi:hypothetical protein